jgi:hypothetical protein
MPQIPYVRATHSDGQLWTPAKANQLEAGCNDLSFSPAVRVTHNALQSINSGTPTALAFNTERIDQAGNAADTMHDNSTNNSRLTCRYAGVYEITAHAVWNAAVSGLTFIQLFLNGATVIAKDGFATGVDYRYMSITTVYPLAVNDYVQVIVNQTSGGAVNIANEANDSPEFMMVRVG